MEKLDVGDDDGHNTLICRCAQSGQDSAAEEGAIGSRRCLPDAGPDRDQRTNNENNATAEDIAARNNNEIRVSQR